MGYCIYCGREWDQDGYRVRGCCKEINGYIEEIEAPDDIDEYKRHRELSVDGVWGF